MQWFGEAWPRPDWPAPVCENANEHVKTPIGQRCFACEEQIADGDNGVVMPYIGTDASGGHFATVRPCHKECWIRSTVGSLAHLNGRCSCHGGDEPDSGMTYRQEAIAVYDWVSRRGV
jgi:hypothetical protein